MREEDQIRGSLIGGAIGDARDTVAEIFKGDEHLPELERIVNLALELSENNRPDLENIHRLGEGWVAEETLGIALYCALKYRNDFSKAIIVSVNHNGDSDSTGAVTGNILGALIGYDAIESKWKKNLELHDVILEMADDLCHGCSCAVHRFLPGVYPCRRKIVTKLRRSPPCDDCRYGLCGLGYPSYPKCLK